MFEPPIMTSPPWRSTTKSPTSDWPPTAIVTPVPPSLVTPAWIRWLSTVWSAPVVLASAANVPVKATPAPTSDGVPSMWKAKVPFGRIAIPTEPVGLIWTPELAFSVSFSCGEVTATATWLVAKSLERVTPPVNSPSGVPTVRLPVAWSEWAVIGVVASVWSVAFVLTRTVAVPESVRLVVAGNVTATEPSAAKVPSEKIRAETPPIVRSIEPAAALRAKATGPLRSMKPGRRTATGEVAVKEKVGVVVLKARSSGELKARPGTPERATVPWIVPLVPAEVTVKEPVPSVNEAVAGPAVSEAVPFVTATFSVPALGVVIAKLPPADPVVPSVTVA